MTDEQRDAHEAETVISATFDALDRLIKRGGRHDLRAARQTLSRLRALIMPSALEADVIRAAAASTRKDS